MEFPKTGDVFEGRYELQSVLGKGGFATVFRARDREMSRDVVIKLLTPVDGGYPRSIAKRFEREARVFTRLQDPHSVTVYDVGESQTGLLFMVFEYVDGRELSELIREGPLEPKVAAHILTQLLKALREAHQLGVLHRDLKPANVLVYEYAGDPFRVKLLDFGIAKELRPDAEKLTKTGNVVGTLRYMAPEQVVGEPVTPASDLYSLGLLGYEMLCGEPAIRGGGQREILVNQVSDARLTVPEDRAPSALRQVIDRLMERSQVDRYQSAADALRDLIAISHEVVSWGRGAGVAPTPPPPSHGLRNVNATRRAWKPYAVAGIAAAVTVMLVGVVLLWPAAPAPKRVVPVSREITSITAPAPDPVRSTAVPVDIGHMAVDSDGCGREPPFVGHGTLADSSFGGGWSTYIPANYDPHRRYPIVLMFHRNLRNGERMIRQTKMDAVADQKGAILIALDSLDPVGWKDHMLVSVERAVEAAHERLCVDRRWRYGLGDGSGGSFLRRLQCVYPMSAAAFAFNGVARACAPVVPTARLKLYGTRDQHIPVEGGMGCNPLDGRHTSAASIEKSWRHEYRCIDETEPWGDFPGGECRVYRQCEVAAFVTCATNDGHQWPGSAATLRSPRCDVPEADPTFPHAEAIWQFFEEFGYDLDSSPESGAPSTPP